MRSLLRAVLKVVIMAATMSCGVPVPRHYDLLWGDQRQRERDIRKDRLKTWCARRDLNPQPPDP
jgi:hypothetical protein